MEPEPRAGELAEKVVVALGPGTGDQSHAQGHCRQRQRGIPAQQPLFLQPAQELGPLGGDAPKQCGDVNLDEDQADLALRPVEIQRAPQHHDHSFGELDALLGQPVPQRCPRAPPALHVQGGHAAPGTQAGGAALLLGVDEAEVEVPRAVVGEVGDLAAHPQVAVPRESLAEGTFDLLVQPSDGQHPVPLAGIGLVLGAGSHR